MSEKIIVDNRQFTDKFINVNNKSLDFYDKKMKALEIENKAQDISMRRKYAEQIFTFVSLYMFGVFFILFLSGSPSSFRMSDSVLMTLLGTTTANVIGILVIVAKYLFPNK